MDGLMDILPSRCIHGRGVLACAPASVQFELPQLKVGQGARLFVGSPSLLLLLPLLCLLCSFIVSLSSSCNCMLLLLLLLMMILLLVRPWHQPLHECFILKVGPVNVEHPALRLQASRQ
jgi:hypothetical protein